MPIIIIFVLFLTPALYFLLKDFRERKPASKVLEPVVKPSIAIPQTRSQTQTKAKSETGIYEGDILDELAKTTLHILFGVMSGGGKSTSMKAIIWKIHQNKPDARFYIVDPKTTDWLGLQRYPGTVSYLSGEVLEQLIELKRVTEQVSDILDRRITRGQNSLLAGGQVGDKEHDIYLIIDEWYSLYDSLKKLPPKLKAEHGLNSIALQVNTIIAKGREHNVHLFLIAQTHLSNETGISTAMRRSLALVGQGRLTDDGDGGYASIEGIIKDPNVFKDVYRRNQLMQVLKQAIAVSVEQNNAPIILTTMGKPRIGLIPDLAEVHRLKIEDYRP